MNQKEMVKIIFKQAKPSIQPYKDKGELSLDLILGYNQIQRLIAKDIVSLTLFAIRFINKTLKQGKAIGIMNNNKQVMFWREYYKLYSIDRYADNSCSSGYQQDNKRIW